MTVEKRLYTQLVTTFDVQGQGYNRSEYEIVVITLSGRVHLLCSKGVDGPCGHHDKGNDNVEHCRPCKPQSIHFATAEGEDTNHASYTHVPQTPPHHLYTHVPQSLIPSNYITKLLCPCVRDKGCLGCDVTPCLQSGIRVYIAV